ncbi:MAG: M18 family aminopeptidase [bacterium]|nr:M18 family aminopeptidase [bacterium]
MVVHDPSKSGKRAALDLASFIDASPSPYHACAEAARRLDAVGFTRLDELASWDRTSGGAYVVRGGSLIAWYAPKDAGKASGFRVLGAHTDSPNLRVKPRPDAGRAGCAQLGVEVYGGVLLNSWLDRDLGLSGRAWLRGEHAPEARLFHVDRPILRVPQLAIHLHSEIRESGLQLNKQTHMQPVWATGTPNAGDFVAFLAEQVGVDSGEILSWEAMVHDAQPSRLIGREEEFLAAPRLDNLCSAHAATSTLVELSEKGADLERAVVVTLFDHEEVGSTSRAGADSPVLGDLLERIVLSRDGSREDYHRAIADSVCVSSDMAHATHPNYPEKHDPDHSVFMNAGPVIKLNANQRYASEGETEALFQVACERAEVPCQKWTMRNDLACGSTIGPITAARLGMRVVDVGNPQLSMHSAREMCGSLDPGYLMSALNAFCD